MRFSSLSVLPHLRSLRSVNELEEQVWKRLQNARAELEEGKSSGLFDHILVNDNLDTCYESLKEELLSGGHGLMLFLKRLNRFSTLPLTGGRTLIHLDPTPMI